MNDRFTFFLNGELHLRHALRNGFVLIWCITLAVLDKHVAFAEEHYFIKRLKYEFVISLPNCFSTLPAFVGCRGDIAPRVPSIANRVFNSAQNFFLGTANFTQRSNFCGSCIRTSSHQAFGWRNDVVALAIADQLHSHSSPPPVASSPRASTQARRSRGNSRDIAVRLDDNNVA